jgi:aminoglycoside 2'-N-acetyltransferase I
VSGAGNLTLRTGHTAALEPSVLGAVRALLDDVFGAVFDEHDYEHALGGVHALVWAGADLIAHGSVVQRRLLHGGRARRTGYVEAVAVREEHRGSGCGAAVMDVLESVIRGAYELGALGSTDGARGFYEHRGWERWQGATSALTPNGVVATPDDDGGIYVLAHDTPLELSGELTCDWRDGDVW